MTRYRSVTSTAIQADSFVSLGLFVGLGALLLAGCAHPQTVTLTSAATATTPAPAAPAPAAGAETSDEASDSAEEVESTPAQVEAKPEEKKSDGSFSFA